MKKYVAITVFIFAAWVSSQAAETHPKHVFIKAMGCDEHLSSSIMASLRQEIRASAGYQLATSLDDSGGFEVVITLYAVCVESTLSSTAEHFASVATIFGTGTCTLGNCHVTSDESKGLGALLCSGDRASSCGRDIYATLDQYMAKAGGDNFNYLSKERVKALGAHP